MSKNNNRKIRWVMIYLCCLLLINCNYDDECGPNINWINWDKFCSNITYDCDNSECNQSDINVLNKMIELSQDINYGMDCNSSGSIEPQEFGDKVWVDGRLIELRISGNGNDEIPEICDPSNVVYHVDKLVIPENIGDLDSLNVLQIETGTNLTNLPETIWNLNNLEDLSLGSGSNSLTSLSENISNLSDLEKLYLDLDGLNTLPDGICSLTKLKELTVSYSQIISIPDSIGKLSNLKILNLGGNQLTSLPEYICNLPTNCYISVNNNKICDEKYHYDCIDYWGPQDCGE